MTGSADATLLALSGIVARWSRIPVTGSAVEASVAKVVSVWVAAVRVFTGKEARRLVILLGNSQVSSSSRANSRIAIDVAQCLIICDVWSRLTSYRGCLECGSHTRHVAVSTACARGTLRRTLEVLLSTISASWARLRLGRLGVVAVEAEWALELG